MELSFFPTFLLSKHMDRDMDKSRILYPNSLGGGSISGSMANEHPSWPPFCTAWCPGWEPRQRKCRTESSNEEALCASTVVLLIQCHRPWLPDENDLPRRSMQPTVSSSMQLAGKTSLDHETLTLGQFRRSLQLGGVECGATRESAFSFIPFWGLAWLMCHFDESTTSDGSLSYLLNWMDSLLVVFPPKVQFLDITSEMQVFRFGLIWVSLNGIVTPWTVRVCVLRWMPEFVHDSESSPRYSWHWSYRRNRPTRIDEGASAL